MAIIATMYLGTPVLPRNFFIYTFFPQTTIRTVVNCNRPNYRSLFALRRTRSLNEVFMIVYLLYVYQSSISIGHNS